jgi:hypothetical protein
MWICQKTDSGRRYNSMRSANQRRFGRPPSFRGRGTMAPLLARRSKGIRGGVGGVALLMAWVALAHLQAQDLTTQPNRLPPGVPPGQQQIVVPSNATDAARYLAGMPVSAESPLTRLTTDPRWIAHSNEMNAAFAKLEQRQLNNIRSWRAEFLGPATAFSRTCLYFFSGPDFLHADAFYPDCSTYVLVSLEPIESIPELQSVPPELLQNTLQTIEVSLNTLVNFGYFETHELHQYLERSQLKGVLPIIFVFLARSGKQILNVDYTSLSRAGARGVKVSFRDLATGAQKVLYYFSADLSDSGLKANQTVLRFCNGLGPTNSFLKADSYLLHQNDFGIARNYLLRVSASILQDDSGIPLRYFAPERWTMRFFGSYTGPINLFKNFYQPDLAHYYAASSPKPLTFGFGYQWNPHDAGLIIAARK